MIFKPTLKNSLLNTALFFFCVPLHYWFVRLFISDSAHKCYFRFKKEIYTFLIQFWVFFSLTSFIYSFESVPFTLKTFYLEPSYFFIHSFIQLIFIEHLLSIRYRCITWDIAMEKTFWFWKATLQFKEKEIIK